MDADDRPAVPQARNHHKINSTTLAHHLDILQKKKGKIEFTFIHD